jgi:hypothetical protein
MAGSQCERANSFYMCFFMLQRIFGLLEVECMGIYVNPGNDNFQRAINSEIYVDKTGMLEYTNSVLGTEQQYMCVSRPRRFGKSMAANMMMAYYSKAADVFCKHFFLKIARTIPKSCMGKFLIIACPSGYRFGHRRDAVAGIHCC